MTSLGGNGARFHAAPALTALPSRDSSALVHEVRDRLRKAILFGEIPSGARLNQVQVAEQLRVSRMPVRVAAADLVAEGLLEHIPSGGVAVRPLTKEDVLQAYEVREALESTAGRSAADGHHEASIDVMFDVLDRHASLSGALDVEELTVLDREFHRTLLEATANPYFTRAMVPMWSVVERSMIIMLQRIPDMFTLAWEQHRGIAEALRTGDADLVEARVREHLNMSVHRLVEAFGDDFGL